MARTIEQIREDMARYTMPFGGVAGTPLSACSRTDLQSFVESEDCENAYPTTYKLAVEFLEIELPARHGRREKETKEDEKKK